MRCPRPVPRLRARPGPARALPAGGGSGSRATELSPEHFPAARATELPPEHFPAARAMELSPEHFPAARATELPPEHFPAARATELSPEHFPAARAMELSPEHFPAARAAAVAVGYLRYLRGGPGRRLELRQLRRAQRQDIDDVGHKYCLELELEDVLDKGRTVGCSAEVLYHLGSTTSAPDVQVTVQGELRSTEEADKEFYNWIRSLEKELVAENIPDSHGNIPPELEPIHLLAWVASGYMIWQNSTENTMFHLAQVKHVKQVKRTDEDLQFDYVLLLHEMVSQEVLPWQVTVLWHPQHGVRVSQCHPLAPGDT